jgi:hypothetical protein
MNVLNKLFGAGSPRFTVIFLHGLTGDPLETWSTSCEEKLCWPNWLEDQFPGLSAYTIGYPASLFAAWAKKEMDIHERAANILEHLAAAGLGATPLAFVCHSLGGILAKEILRAASESSDEAWQAIATNTKLVCFFGTPHLGASLASAIKFIGPRLSSTHIDLLSNDGGYLQSLNQAFRTMAQTAPIRTIAYYEKYKTKGAAIVVPRESADPGVGTFQPIAIDADHISICKPRSKEDLIFQSLCRHISAVYPKEIASPSGGAGNGAFELEDYSKRSTSDRRDLLQKLIDAGREHEYQAANGLQNRFAQRYYKHGLFTAEKLRSDSLLAAVEQRFLTHVYTPKICKRASDDEIAHALQAHVIDPISADGARAGVNSAAVLQALYFLTEQCHIQWDAP